MEKNKFKKLALECLKYCNKRNNTKIKIRKVYKDDMDYSATAGVDNYESGNNFDLEYGSHFLDETNKDLLDTYNYYHASTGLKLKNSNEFYVFTILHEIGHMNRLYKYEFNFTKYLNQRQSLYKWNKKQIKNKKVGINRINHMYCLKYRRIEEEKIADSFAKEHFKGCMEYLKNKGVI